MSRKDWSESKRCEEIEKRMDRIERLEMELSHLQSDKWEEPYPTFKPCDECGEVVCQCFKQD